MHMIPDLFCVMIGGAMGAALRYGTGLALAGVRVAQMPVGTIAVNMVGCLLMGLLTAAGQRYTGIPPRVMLMLSVGVCGALTTFSTFTAETMKAMQGGLCVQAMVYAVISVVGGMLCYALGRWLI